MTLTYEAMMTCFTSLHRCRCATFPSVGYSDVYSIDQIGLVCGVRAVMACLHHAILLLSTIHIHVDWHARSAFAYGER